LCWSKADLLFSSIYSAHISFPERGANECIVNGFHGEVGVLHFEPAAGGKVLEGLFEDPTIVAETGHEEAAVDYVEFLRVGPFVFDILNFEGTIWRYAALLVLRTLLVEKNTYNSG
jgi:hypothetical protein